MKTDWTVLRSFFSGLRKDRKGSVAITFAFATIPLIIAVGAAVDYSRANSVKAAMQTALDSTVLMLSKDAANLTQDQMNTKAYEYFTAMFSRPDASNIVVGATYTTGTGTTLVINASAEVPTKFMGIVGYHTFHINDSSTAKWGYQRLRVSLVLDNTGSMGSDGKIAALKTATKNLLTQLQSAVAIDGDVYVSIIPFSKDVNVGSSNFGASWIYWDNAAQTDNSSWDANNGSCSPSGPSPRSACLAQPNCSLTSYTDQSSCTSNGICSISTKTTPGSCTGFTGCTNPGETTKNSCQNNKACTLPAYTSRNSCQSHGGTWDYGTWGAGVWTVGVWTTYAWNHKTHNSTNWNGCITDRGLTTGPSASNYDQNITAPGGTDDSKFPAEQFSGCVQAMMGLNYDWSAMSTMVDNMVATGNTNQPIGLVWGWQSLVGGGPFTAPAMDPNYQYQQIVILLTDGLNTQNRWSTNQTTIDNRMYDSTGNGTCKNMKANGITIYTIQVNTGSPGDPESAMLKNCASNTTGTYDHYFMLTSADQIVTTFNKIGDNLTKLRIAY
jgi:Flp pilus assembly protein TadG